jgi:hypothetical protein
MYKEKKEGMEKKRKKEGTMRKSKMRDKNMD